LGLNNLVLCPNERVTDNFKLSYGVRVDVPVWEDVQQIQILIQELFLY
jgi:hypothetical protein